jgi:hypothetical protein
MENCMILRRALIVFSVLPMLLFMLMPLAPMSPAFDGPSLTMAWGSQA